MVLHNRLIYRARWPISILILLFWGQLSFVGEVLAQKAEQKKSPSDKVVRVIENLAIPSLQNEYMRSDGTVVKLDKSDPKKLQIPMEDKRRVIRVGRWSAWAVICQLKDLSALNYNTMYELELKKKKWSKEQLAVIHSFHMSTLAFFAGDVEFSEDDPKDKDGRKKVSSLKKIECSEKQREVTKQTILEYVAKAKKS